VIFHPFFKKIQNAAFENIRQLFGFLTWRSVLVWIRVQGSKSASEARSFIHLTKSEILIVPQNSSHAGALAVGSLAQVWSLGIETSNHGDGFMKALLIE
jgi:hypothetical protein